MDQLIGAVFTTCHYADPEQQKLQFCVRTLDFITFLYEFKSNNLDLVRLRICQIVSDIFCILKIYPYTRHYRPTLHTCEIEQPWHITVGSIKVLLRRIIIKLSYVST